MSNKTEIANPSHAIDDMSNIASASHNDVSLEQRREIIVRAITDHGHKVSRCDITGVSEYGDGATSTAERISADVFSIDEDQREHALKVIVKIERKFSAVRGLLYPLYDNELNFYQRIGSDVGIETPTYFGGYTNSDEDLYALVLEDLRPRGARFMSAMTPHSVDEVKSLLGALASLHGRYWESPRFATDLAWLETRLTGAVSEHFSMLHPHICMLVETVQFKREMLQRAGVTADDLRDQVAMVQRHQASLPQTLIHGDAHSGNTYIVSGTGGWLDWQLMARSYFMCDVVYYLVTALDVESRRSMERDLLRYYLDCLKAAGATNVPNWETAWLEYRRAAVWPVYIGWLTAPVENYGWEMTVANHMRVFTAYEDLNTKGAIESLT